MLKLRVVYCKETGHEQVVEKVIVLGCSYLARGAARCPCLAVAAIRRGVRQRHLTPPHADGFTTEH